MRKLPWWSATLLLASACQHEVPLQSSIGQLERVRAGVRVVPEGSSAAQTVGTVRRLQSNDRVETEATGRAVLSMDGGGRYVLDRSTQARVLSSRAITLETGRLWISGGGEGGRSEENLLTLGGVTLHIRGARASVERANGHTTVSVLSGELAWETSAHHGAIHTGETANLDGDNVQSSPVVAFSDWTGGLADDLPAGGGEAAGLGALGAREPGELGSPRWAMVMQRLDLTVHMEGDLAVTTVEQTFFNPSARTVEGLYTFYAPAGAVLQSFGVDRRGVIVDGIVRERQQAAAQYQAQVYQGSTHDPALLEWDAPGRYHARLYPLAAGSTRRIRVRYTQWLQPDGQGRRAYRLPLASLGTRIGEFRADLDFGENNVALQSLRTVAGATYEDGHLYIAQSDVLPRADLVVEMQGAPALEATSVRVPATNDPRGNFLRVAVQAPIEAARTPTDEGVDLVLVVDHSAATDPLALRLEQAFVESLLANLDERDSVLVLAGDVQTRPVGSTAAELHSVTAEYRRTMSEALAADHLGGATDLGAMIAAANAALRPGRNGAIVYVGDGIATVGEAQLPSLRQVLSRMAPRPRFYAIAVGEEPQLDLLSGLAAPAGFAARVARRGDVARTALDLLGHVSRPLVRNFRVELGAGVQYVYPAEPVDLPAGEPLVVVGRYTGQPPVNLRVRALWNGQEVVRTVPLRGDTIEDSHDLQYRWATARLENLLARGESRPVIVELGTRFGLITPFTSLYVRSEDEVGALEEELRAREAPPSRFAQLEVSDFFPLVGCSRARSSAALVSGLTSANEPAPAAQEAEQQGGTGTRHAGEEGRMAARSARYAVAQNAAPSSAGADDSTPSAPAAAAAPPRLSRQAASEQVQNRGVFAALGAPGGGAGGGASGIVSPFGAVTESAAADRNANGNMAGAETGDAFGYGGLGANGQGWGGGGTGEGTIGMGNVGTMGHGSGTGTGQGYGNGAGRGLSGRANRGPLVRAAPPEVTGMLSPEAIRRVVLRNLGQVAHCHEQGLAQNPNLEGRVVVRFLIGGTGSVMGSAVADSNLAVPSVAQCIANAVRRWQFPSPEGGGVVTVNYPFNLQHPDGGDYTPPPTPPAPTANVVAAGGGGPAPTPSEGRTVSRCSDAAAVPLRERIPLWRERLANASGPSGALEVYRGARRACETPAWADRVALLRLMTARVSDLSEQISLYNQFSSDPGPRHWLRDLLLRTLARRGELARAQELGLGRIDAATMTAALGRAATPEARLAVLGELARRYPDDLDLGIRYLELATELHQNELVRAQAQRLRGNAQADARVRTAAGEALLAIGDEREARRAFSEIVEFAPEDPAARRRMGDIALSHGWADEAYRQFQMLAQQSADAPDVLLRQAIASRMAGRLDEAIRLAQRVAEQGGQGGVGDVVAAWVGVELALAAQSNHSDDTVQRLRARWLHSPAARSAGAVRIVLRWLHPDDAAELSVGVDRDPPRPADTPAGELFLTTTVLPEAPTSLQLEVRRAVGARSVGHAELLVVWGEGTSQEVLHRQELTLDDAHPRFLFAAARESLRDVTPPPPPPPPPGAPAPAAAARRAALLPTRRGGAL